MPIGHFVTKTKPCQFILVQFNYVSLYAFLSNFTYFNLLFICYLYNKFAKKSKAYTAVCNTLSLLT